MGAKKIIFPLGVFMSLAFSIATTALAAPPMPALKIGDAAGGALTGTYPNPDLANGVVTLPKLSAGTAEAGQILTSPDGSSMEWSNSVPFLEITGSIDASGGLPEIQPGPFCLDPNARALDGSNQVRGEVVMGPTDQQCTFTWAAGTEYGGNVYCVASVSGNGPPAPVGVTAGPTGMVINKVVTPTSLAITYMCMGPRP